MQRPRFEVAEVLRLYGSAYRQNHAASMSLDQLRIMRDTQTCRTAALGGHVDACESCGVTQISYNSCCNRHCPKCQSLAKAKWLEARLGELLPVEYFHVVFTLPDQVASIALQNKRMIYNLLFRTVARTLRTIAADPKHLGAQIGFLAVLHSWGQNLHFHPHLHCIVPGGGFDAKGQRWIACRPGFFVPVRVLSRLFRRLFLEALDQAFHKGELEFHGTLVDLRACEAFQAWLEPARKAEWVVYSKKPFAGPQKVLDYLGRYTHRVAISNHRILNIEDGKVTFRWRDYRHGNRPRTLTLEAEEFLRRFFLHTLPKGFVRIRHYGFLANRQRAGKLESARELLQVGGTEQTAQGACEDWKAFHKRLIGTDPTLCPVCHQGQLVCIETLDPEPDPTWILEKIDSS